MAGSVGLCKLMWSSNFSASSVKQETFKLFIGVFWKLCFLTAFHLSSMYYTDDQKEASSLHKLIIVANLND